MSNLAAKRQSTKHSKLKSWVVRFSLFFLSKFYSLVDRESVWCKYEQSRRPRQRCAVDGARPIQMWNHTHKFLVCFSYEKNKTTKKKRLNFDCVSWFENHVDKTRKQLTTNCSQWRFHVFCISVNEKCECETTANEKQEEKTNSLAPI